MVLRFKVLYLKLRMAFLAFGVGSPSDGPPRVRPSPPSVVLPVLAIYQRHPAGVESGLAIQHGLNNRSYPMRGREGLVASSLHVQHLNLPPLRPCPS